ncbi:hypothetical protein [Paracoccus fistulariae]|uniref:Uncharacterized protein n=1 Tax=Paracoccus fistulariae TaxID=658446 RepID=A0ABY7SQJ1_9RHOB|nr:hypothetical protein [Paracoccus fistulariae]MDB6183086.1 hypothetical protein [Paracoccus fistulariae]WCR09159.1 hypothetical protein JHX87_18240 [Paracoccus fistulariae]
MSDNPSPADKDKIADILAIIVAKGDEQKAALIELADQTRQTKTVLSDVLAQRSEYAADIRDLKAAIDTTRRALDPKALAEHVADNNNAFMGEITEKFARALNANANATTSCATQTEPSRLWPTSSTRKQPSSRASLPALRPATNDQNGIGSRWQRG